MGAPRAPGSAGRISSGHAGQTRRQLQPLGLANLQHLPPLARTGFAPRAGGGLGAGPPSAGSAPTLTELKARIPLECRRTRGGSGVGEHWAARPGPGSQRAPLGPGTDCATGLIGGAFFLCPLQGLGSGKCGESLSPKAAQESLGR